MTGTNIPVLRQLKLRFCFAKDLIAKMDCTVQIYFTKNLPYNKRQFTTAGLPYCFCTAVFPTVHWAQQT